MPSHFEIPGRWVRHCSPCQHHKSIAAMRGGPGKPRWVCQGCCKRMLDALEKILRYPVHSEPVGGAMAMQDIAHEAMSPNDEFRSAGPETSKCKPAGGPASPATNC